MIQKERVVGKIIYNPISQVPSPGGLSQYLPARCGELAGTVLKVWLDGFLPLTVQFLDMDTLVWATEGERFREETYDCAKNDDTTYLIAFSLSGRTPNTAILLFWDQISTMITAIVPALGANEARPRLVHAQVYFGAERSGSKPLTAQRQTYTDEMIGKRILWQYTPNDRVMHIYRSQECFRLWLVQPQLADTATEAERTGFQRFIDRRSVYPIYEEPLCFIKLKDDLYLYYTIEANLNRVLPKQGGGLLAVMLNTRRERYVGCVYGGDAENKPTRAIIGAVGHFINEPDEVERHPAPFYPVDHNA